MSTKFTVGQMNQLGDALEGADFSADDVTKLRNYPELKSIKNVLLGRAKIVMVEHVIDCDADPYIPDGWKVEEHIKGGQFTWDSRKVELFLSQKQKKGSMGGNELRQELKGKPVLNAIVLDYLLAHPELIPEEWKGKYIFFWGTIYRHSDGGLCVRYLSWDDGQWGWGYFWLGSGWDDYDPAALARK